MATYVRYYDDASGTPVVYTDYVDLKTQQCTETITRNLEVIEGNAGSNTYRDDQRYTKQWTIVALCDKRTTEALRGFADNAFTANTTLRVYDKYASAYYNDYASVKIQSFSSVTTDAGSTYTVTLTVVK